MRTDYVIVWKRNPSHSNEYLIEMTYASRKMKSKTKQKSKTKRKTKSGRKKYDNDEQTKNVLIKYRKTIYCKIDIYFLKFVIYFSCN